MEQKASNAEMKRLNKIRIAKYIYHHGTASKQELASALGFSMPTVLQRVRELIEEGIVTESGEYESTGGRKAKVLSIEIEGEVRAGTGHHKKSCELCPSGRSRYYAAEKADPLCL